MDKKLWYKILRKNTLVKETSEIGDPMSFKDVKDWAKKNFGNKNVKLVYGTRSKKFHVIDKNDRDWVFAVTPKEFLKFSNEKEAINVLTSMRII